MKVSLVDLEGTKFDLEILFWRTKNSKHQRRRTKIINGKVKELIDTHCQVICNGRKIAHTIAYQSPRDNYNKIVGRKVALAKAIQQLGFLGFHECLTATNNHRYEMRKEIWRVFKSTFMKQLISID